MVSEAPRRMEMFPQKTNEAIQMRLDLFSRSLQEGRWAAPRTLEGADEFITALGNPLIDRLKDGLAPFLTKPLGYSDALNHALDEEKRASQILGIEDDYSALKYKIGDILAPTLKNSFISSFWKLPPDPVRLPTENYKTLQQMLEVTERSITWEVTSQAQNIRGLDNPFLPFVYLYMNGIVKVKFETNEMGGQWIKAHIPLRYPGRNASILGCWTEMEEGISGTHGWGESCNQKKSVSRILGV